MTRRDHRQLSRRSVLRSLGQATAVAGGLAATKAFGQDATLDALINQNVNGDFGQSFDSGSRNIQMPKVSLPTLSPATVQHTEQAIAQFDGIVAKGGWPEVARVDRLRLGSRQPAVIALRQRLITSGDLDANAGVSDVYHPHFETAVKRIQAPHRLSAARAAKDQTMKTLH